MTRDIPDPGDIEHQITASYDQSPGSAHYRAYVGGSRQFDRKAASQFRLLTTLGLRERHHVLEIGCGSLCLGRLLICYLLPGRYCGIEPETRLWQEMVHWELSPELLARKAPRFDANRDFDLSAFGGKFDLVVASAVFTHTGHDLLLQALERMRGVLANRTSQALFNLKCGDPGGSKPGGMDNPGWHYPDSVRYDAEEATALATRAGLFCEPLGWHDGTRTWFRAVLREEALLDPEEHALLDGRTILDLRLQRRRRSRAAIDPPGPSR